MSRVVNIEGQRFGKVTVIQYIGKNQHRKALWECLCACGNRVILCGSALRSGNTTSCGCRQKAIRTHGESRVDRLGSREYRSWAGMLSRCRNPKDTNYHNYGGRGIIVCERWLLFENFLTDMGRKPTMKHTIDRIDNNGNYEPNNCRWATKREQDTNRRQTRLVTYNGETLCLKDWAKRFSMSYDVLLQRLDKGWSFILATSTPVKVYRRRRASS